MPELRVDLQEGFAGDLVVLQLNGDEVYRARPKTRLQTGLAELRAFHIADPARPLLLEVQLPDLGVSRSFPCSFTGNELYVGVNRDEHGAISFRSSQEPFGYL